LEARNAGFIVTLGEIDYGNSEESHLVPMDWHHGRSE